MTLTQMRKGIVKLLGLALLLVTIHYPLATAVLAHSDYDRSVPAADEVVLQAPQQVQVWFTQELFRREGKNSLEVYGPGQQRIGLDDAAIDDDDRKLMTVSLPPDFANGVYIVRWRTLSADDGDDANGEFQFTVDADEPTAEAGQPADSPDAAPSATPTAAVGNTQPSPTNTAQVDSTGPQSTPPAADPASEGPESPPGQADQGPGLPCLGSSFPVLLLLGAFLIAGRRRRLSEPQSQGIWRGLSGKKK